MGEKALTNGPAPPFLIYRSHAAGIASQPTSGKDSR
jgi:hypothetical protein